MLSPVMRELLDGPNFATLATINADGSPQASTMWASRQDGYIIMNTAVGRAKWRNLRRDPRVAVSVFDLVDPYRTATVAGRVVEMRTSDGVAVINALAKKYLDLDVYPWHDPNQQRVTIVIEPISQGKGDRQGRRPVT